MKKDSDEAPQEQSSTFVRPPKHKDWRVIAGRIGVIAGITVLVCLFILRPMVISGGSMMPTYSSSGFTFAFLPYFKLYDPQRQQIVILSHAGFNNFLLKRILAFPGETVEIHNGVLYVNGKALDEPYVKYPCNWNLAPVEVPKSKIFVLGDNRSMPIKNHMGGMIDRDRLAGVPIW